MKKKQIHLVLVLLIAGFALIALLGSQKDPYSVQVEGVVLKGINASPLEIIPAVASQNDFIVSAVVQEPLGEGDSLMFNGAALFLVVLTGNGKKTTQLLRVTDKGNTLNYCLTNYGNLRTEEKISAEKCNGMLNDDEKVVILIDLPDPTLSSPTVLLSKKRITIKANSFDAVNNTCFTVLKAMFSNAEQVLSKSNAVAGMLS